MSRFIQTLKLKKVQDDRQLDKLSRFYTFDYMGAAEYEMGAAAKCNTFIKSNWTDYQFDSIVVNDKPVFIYAHRDKIDAIKTFIADLGLRKEADYQLKESCRFFDMVSSIEVNPYLAVDMWYDFGEHFGDVAIDSEEYPYMFTLDKKMLYLSILTLLRSNTLELSKDICTMKDDDVIYFHPTKLVFRRGQIVGYNEYTDIVTVKSYSFTHRFNRYDLYNNEDGDILDHINII